MAIQLADSTAPTTDEPAKEDAATEGFNVLLMGPAGTGKTYDIGSLVDADPNLHVHCIFLEAGSESLRGYWKDKGKPIPPNVSWHIPPKPKASFTEMIETAKQINLLSYEALTKMQDPNKGKYNRFVQLLEALNKPQDDRTGRTFEPVDQWGMNRALVIDGMTGIGLAAMALVIGGKAVRSPSEWGVAQDQVEKIVRMLCDNCRCHFVLIAHVEKETDQVLGGTKLFVSTLGKALAPKIAPMFSDVILTVRNGDTWTWDTSNPLADVKGRNLPFKAGLAPSFKQILDKWKLRGGVLT